MVNKLSLNFSIITFYLSLVIDLSIRNYYITFFLLNKNEIKINSFIK
jgi:hypothetical protein